MPGTDPTDRGAQDQTVNRGTHLDRLAIIDTIEYGVSTDDTEGEETESGEDADEDSDTPNLPGPVADLNYARGSSEDGADLNSVDVMPGVLGETPPLSEGDPVIVRWFAGNPPQPYVSGSYYNQEDQAPRSSGEYSMNLGGSRVEMLENGDVNIDAAGKVTIKDSEGTLTTSAGGSAGGDNNFSGGDLATDGTGAGGDGTGTGEPGFNTSNTVDAVADLGMDSSGGSAINSAIGGISDGTRVNFPAGTYLLQPTNDTGATVDGNNILLAGAGETRDDVKFIVPSDKAGTGFTFTGSNVGLVNATFDHSADPASIFGLTVAGSGDKYFYNIQHVGTNVPSLSLHGPIEGQGGGKMHCWGFGLNEGATCRIENYSWTDEETRIEPYPNGLIGMQAPLGMAGTIDLVNCHMAGRSEHNVYASRCKGNVRVKGGLYENSCNSNLRIEGGDSYVEDATIHVGMDPARPAQGDKSARGVWFENNKATATSGGHIRNCDFVFTSQIESGNSSAIVAQYNTSGLTVENCRFRYDDNSSPCCQIMVPGVTFKNCHFTGSSNKPAVAGNGDTVVENSCNTISGGFGNCRTSNISTSGCEQASL